MTVSDPAPTVSTAASASPTPVTGTTTALSVLGADYKGESTLTYTWATTGTPPATVTFSANGTNAAKNTTATFAAAGTYSFQVTISDGQVSTTSSVTVTVNQTLTTIIVTPASPTVDETLTQQFTAVAYDQFGDALSSQPTLTWSTSGIGSVSTSGLYTAPDSTGASSVTAMSGSISGTAAVTVSDPAPTVTTAPAATPAPVIGTTTALSVLGADYKGESALNYTWATTGTPPATVTFSANGTNAAKNTTATFTAAGTYSFRVTITDGQVSTTSSVTVTVNQTLTTIIVTPSSPTVDETLTQQFTAVAYDQFSNAMSTQPTFTWSNTGAGSVSTGGLYTAADSLGADNVTAASGSVSGTAAVTVSDPAPTVPTAASATPTPVTGTTTALSVLGDDYKGDSTLTYTWTTTGTPPAAVTFSANGTNAAKNTTGTFTAAGTYSFRVTISDGQVSTTSSVTVTVSQTLTTINVAPSSPTVNETLTQQFSAVAYDQFGNAMSSQPTLTWSDTGSGSVSTSGLYTAPDSLGTDSVTATSGSVTGTATVTVSDPLPTVTTAASASPTPVTGTTTALSVLGGDYKGESTLTYTWAITGTPPATVTFSANGTNAAKNTTATFTAAGTYSFQVTISDGQVSTTSSVTVTVNQTLTTIYVTPSSPTLDETQTQPFTAMAYDQFGEALSSPPTFTWSNTGIGSVSTGGLYTAPDSTGAASVTATSGSVSGTTTVTVDALPTVSTPATATSDTVTGTTTQLNVLGSTSSYAESDLIYTWAAVSLPTGADPTYSVNGTNAAKSTTVTFNETGDYTFQVTIADPLGGAVTSTVEITVAVTATSITVSPVDVTLNAFQTEQFQATVVDQFGNTVTSPSGLTWTVTGGGTISSTGLFTAPDADASATVEASCGSVNATASVSISVPAPAVTGLSTSSGSVYGGTAVTITGNYFTGASSVMFGSLPAASYTINNDGSISAVAPQGFLMGTVAVTVTTPYGTSLTSSSDQFTFADVTPVITSVSTTSGSAFGGDSLTITGTNFTGVNQLMFGTETTLFFTVINDTTIVAIAPDHAAGTFDISVSSPTEASATTTADEFTYVNTVATLENQNYTFTSADFAYSDPNDTAGSAFSAIEITTLPSTGTLTDNGNEVTPGQSVPVADLNAGLLVFSPVTDANGTAYASFTYQVATGEGGATVDPTLKTMTINVTPVTQAPTGTSHTVSTPMNNAYAFSTADFGFSDPHNSPGYNLLAVEITTLPTSGVLTDNGVNVTAGQFVTDVDLSNSVLVFTPAENATGTDDASFQFKVQSNGLTSNGGQNVDPSPKTITVNVTNVTQPPVGTPNTVKTLENGSYTFAASDFGFTDPNNSPANSLAAVEITTLPSAGTLTDNGTAVTAGQFISVTDLNFGLLVFTPATNASGSAYATFTFQVQSNGLTAYGGVNVDTTARTMTINVVAVPQTPVGTSTTVAMLDDLPYTFGVNDFGFTEPSAANSSHVLQAVEITSLPTHGSLTDNGVAVTAGQFVSAGDISGGYLVFTPGASASGAAYSQFTFQVQDNGGTASGRVDTDPSAKTMTINAVSTPIGTSKTVQTTACTPYVFSTSDFGLTEPSGSDNSLLAVKITAPPAAGTLADNGVAVTAGQFVSASDISSGKLIYTPPAGVTSKLNTVFAFQVQDNGGTADGRVNTDPMARAMIISVMLVNLAPAGTSNAVTTSINTPYTFATTDFGFSDPNPSPANSLLAVEITTLPTAGTLTDNGVAVTAGQFVNASDIAASELVFTPATNATGSAYASFTFQVEDSGSTAGGGVTVDPTARTMTIGVTTEVSAPVLSGDISYAQGGSNVAVAVNPSIRVTDATNSTLVSATITITNFVATEDVLSFTAVPASMGNISGSFNATTGVLSLTSAGAKATLAQWDAALQSVTYTDTSSTPNATPRQIAITVNNGQATNNTSAPLTTTVLTEPSTPVFTSGSFSLALNADAQPGDSVGVLLATDPNPSDTLTFSLSGTGTDLFAINATTGEVTYTGGTLTAGNSYSLTATVTNQAGASSTATVETSVLSAGSSGATGSQPLAVPTGLSATYSYNAGILTDGTTTTSSSGSYSAGVLLGNANAIATGTQSLTVTTTTVGDPTTTQVTTWSYNITTSNGAGDTVHEWGGYTETQTATTDATTGLTTSTSTTFTSVDNYDDTDIQSDATGTSTAHAWGSTSVSYSASNSTATSSTPGSASDSYSETSSGGYTSSGSYTDPIDGGSVSGSESSSGSYSDTVSESDAFSGDTSGNWWQTSGSASASDSSTDSGSSSGSGSYTTPLSGGSMTGSVQESGSESDSESDSITETYVTGSGWSSSGSASASGSSSSSDSYSGSGSYSTSSATDTTSGTSSESGGSSEQSQYQDSYAWASGTWVMTSGTESDSSSGSDSASYSETGSYTSNLSDDDPTIIGTVSGTTSGSGTDSDQYSDSTSDTYNAGTGQWTTSGSGSESGSDSSESSSSGSGTYMQVMTDGADSGSYSETGSGSDSDSYTLQSVMDGSGNSTTTGTGSGSDSYSSSDSFSGSGSYSDSLPGGTMSGTETDSDTGGETGGDSYTTTWDDASGDWVLTSGSGSDSVTTGFSSSYSGSGTFTASGTMTDDYGDPNGAWSETSSGSESGSYSSSETGTGNYQVVNGAWQDTGDTGTDSEQGTDTTSSSTSGTYTEGALSGSYSASGTSTESFSVSDSDGPSGITGTASESSSGTSTESDSYSGTSTYGGTTGSYSGSDTSSASNSVTESYALDPTTDDWILSDGSTETSSTSSSSTESFSGTAGSSGTADYASYSFSDSTSGSGSDNWTASGGNWVESSATDSGSSSASSTYSSVDSESYVSQYGIVGTSTGSEKASSTESYNWSDSMNDGTWSYTGGGSATDSSSSSSKESASGSYSDGADTGSYSESTSASDSEGDSITDSRASDGSWLENGSSSGSGSQSASANDTRTSVVTTGGSGGSDTVSTSGSAGSRYSDSYSSSATLTNNNWGLASGSGSGSGSDSETTSSTTTGTYSYQFDSNQGTVSGTISGGGSTAYSDSYTDTFTMFNGAWQTSETGSGKQSSSGSSTSTGSGSYTVSGSPSGTSTFDGITSVYSGTSTTSASISESNSASSKTSASFSWTDNAWTVTSSSSGSASSMYHYSSSGSSTGTTTIGDYANGNGGYQSGSNTSKTDILSTAQSSYSNTSTTSVDASGNETSTTSGTSTATSSSNTTSSMTMSYYSAVMSTSPTETYFSSFASSMWSTSSDKQNSSLNGSNAASSDGWSTSTYTMASSDVTSGSGFQQSSTAWTDTDTETYSSGSGGPGGTYSTSSSGGSSGAGPMTPIASSSSSGGTNTDTNPANIGSGSSSGGQSGSTGQVFAQVSAEPVPVAVLEHREDENMSDALHPENMPADASLPENVPTFTQKLQTLVTASGLNDETDGVYDLFQASTNQEVGFDCDAFAEKMYNYLVNSFGIDSSTSVKLITAGVKGTIFAPAPIEGHVMNLVQSQGQYWVVDAMRDAVLGPFQNSQDLEDEATKYLRTVVYNDESLSFKFGYVPTPSDFYDQHPEEALSEKMNERFTNYCINHYMDINLYLPPPADALKPANPPAPPIDPDDPFSR